MCMCWYPARGRAPDQSFMLADARTPAVLADAPAAVKLADARAPAVLSVAPALRAAIMLPWDSPHGPCESEFVVEVTKIRSLAS